jgi:hypothetical protein
VTESETKPVTRVEGASPQPAQQAIRVLAAGERSEPAGTMMNQSEPAWLAKEVSSTKKSHEHMDVIVDAVDLYRHASQPAHSAAKVCMQPGP